MNFEKFGSFKNNLPKISAFCLVFDAFWFECEKYCFFWRSKTSYHTHFWCYFYGKNTHTVNRLKFLQLFFVISTERGYSIPKFSWKIVRRKAIFSPSNSLHLLELKLNTIYYSFWIIDFCYSQLVYQFGFLPSFPNGKILHHKLQII